MNRKGKPVKHSELKNRRRVILLTATADRILVRLSVSVSLSETIERLLREEADRTGLNETDQTPDNT